jgi:hypothetical protein
LRVTLYVPPRLPANEHVPEAVPPAVSVIELGHETVSRPVPVGPLTIFDRFTLPAKPAVVVGRLVTVTEMWPDAPDWKVTLVEFVDRLTPVT